MKRGSIRMLHTIELKEISKEIDKSMVLNHISCEFHSGEIYGIVGRNGSGKTMLFRLICGLIFPTSGKILVDGQEVLSCTEKLTIGLMLENIGLYQDLTILENLICFAKIHKKVGKEEIYEAIRAVGLEPEDKRKIKKYSLGMRQKAVIAQAIMEKPDMLIFDEPSNALDSQGVEMLREIIKMEAKRGAIVVLASHNKEDIQILSKRIYEMEQGNLKEITLK